jgi:hypothetical protein
MMNWLQGKKTYIALIFGAIVIALNHFGLLPPGYVTLNSENWLVQEFFLLLGATGRSAVAKIQPAAN